MFPENVLQLRLHLVILTKPPGDCIEIAFVHKYLSEKRISYNLINWHELENIFYC